MRISVLMDDTASSPAFACEHGLSFYLSDERRRILFDMGASGLFLDNARQLGIDMARTELAVLSHGHVDHGGGLGDFLRACPGARVYLHADALKPHYTRRASGAVEYIGIDPRLACEPRLVPLQADLRLDGDVTLFSSVGVEYWRPQTQGTHLAGGPGGLRPDSFSHEQSLLFRSGDTLVLVAGCAHRGILNILSRAVELAGRPVDAVVGGFHLSNPRDGGCVPEETLDLVAEGLLRYPGTAYYTCHCTGAEAFEGLWRRMGERLHWVGAGAQLDL